MEQPLAKDVVNESPLGAFIYFTYKDREVVEEKLKSELPGRLVVVTEEKYMLFPNDMGTQFGDDFYCYSLGRQYILSELGSSLGMDREGLRNKLGSLLPNFVLGGEYRVEGGKTVSVPRSGRILIGDHPGPGLSAMIGKVERDHGREIELVQVPKLFKTVSELTDKSSGTEDSKLYIGHIDSVVTAVPQKDGGVHYYMDEKVYNAHGGDFDSEFTRAGNELRVVSHQGALKGGLNISHVDNAALVTRAEYCGDELVNDLMVNGFKVVELGDQFYRRGGPKCRSLVLNWKK